MIVHIVMRILYLILQTLINFVQMTSYMNQNFRIRKNNLFSGINRPSKGLDFNLLQSDTAW